MKIERQAETAADDERIKKAFGVKNPHFAFTCGGMRRIFVNPDDRRARRMLLRKGFRYFSKNQFIIYCITKLIPVDALLDVGTNYGECLISLPLYSKVRARGFEANPYLVEYIERSIAHNDDLHDVAVAPLAMSNRAGEKVAFHIDTRWSGKSSFSLNPEKSDVVTVKVPTTTIDSEITALGNVTTALIKIDVEGHEPEVMQGAADTNALVRNLIYVMEFDANFLANSGHNPKYFFDDLRSKFSMYKIEKDGLRRFSNYEDMVRESEKLHVDLVMVKLDDKIKNMFERRIVNRRMAELRRSLWGDP